VRILSRFLDVDATPPLHKKASKNILNKEYGTIPLESEAKRTDDFPSEGQNPRSILIIAHILGSHVPVWLAIVLIVGSDLSYLLQPPPDRQHVAPTWKNMPNTHCTYNHHVDDKSKHTPSNQ
jgi:hypothetical protein